eukprot:3260213-Rhodomonas_salina.5
MSRQNSAPQLLPPVSASANVQTPRGAQTSRAGSGNGSARPSSAGWDAEFFHGSERPSTSPVRACWA